jgi:hypothetical protein
MNSSRILVEPDNFSIIYNSYFFDNVNSVGVNQLEQGPINLNDTFTHTYDQFKLLKDDSLLPLSENYEELDYFSLPDSKQRIEIKKN